MDLVFFSSTGNGITHVVLYIDNSSIIHSLKLDYSIKIDNISSSHYSSIYVTSKNIL
ncbi:NlpC/P60 family protein [Romboutsia sp.]|uniref:NlpC/P60 family protein n=1 Tax=Romboutsia sp. TaxID=1965302 RepID=UPI002B78D3FC|nr:NlpC/P60 family protein [Romboutsia sp.]HSQ87294.1 NlpC/P60 family protein [Romboutsia sp.]